MDFQQRLVLQGSLLKYIYQSFGMKDYDPNILFPYKRVTDEDPNQTESLYADNGTDDPTTNEADGGSLTDDDDVDDSTGKDSSLTWIEMCTFYFDFSNIAVLLNCYSRWISHLIHRWVD